MNGLTRMQTRVLIMVIEECPRLEGLFIDWLPRSGPLQDRLTSAVGQLKHLTDVQLGSASTVNPQLSIPSFALAAPAFQNLTYLQVGIDCDANFDWMSDDPSPPINLPTVKAKETDINIVNSHETAFSAILASIGSQASHLSLTVDDRGGHAYRQETRLNRESLNRILAPYIISTDLLHLAFMTSNPSLRHFRLLNFPEDKTSVALVADPVMDHFGHCYMTHTFIGLFQHVMEPMFRMVYHTEEDLVGRKMWVKKGSNFLDIDMAVMKRLATLSKKQIMLVRGSNFWSDRERGHGRGGWRRARFGYLGLGCNRADAHRKLCCMISAPEQRLQSGEARRRRNDFDVAWLGLWVSCRSWTVLEGRRISPARC